MNAGFAVRHYRADDWLAVCGIYDLAKPDEMRGVVAAESIPSLQADTLMQELFNTSDIMVAERQGRVVAFAGKRQSSITWLFVHPQHRKLGIAKGLVQGLLAIMNGPVSLKVVRSNDVARSLYAGLGFVVDREFVGDFNSHICAAVRMSLSRVSTV